MQWLNTIVEELMTRQPDGEILLESGASPSGTYHLGHMRELLTPDAVLLELKKRGREVRHIHFVDDLDAFRKVPVNIPAEYEKYLGMPLCDIPAPDGSERAYSDYFLDGFKEAGAKLGIQVEYVYAHEKYRSGAMVPVIERALERIPQARQALEAVSGRQLDEHWSPIQVMEQGRLKNRQLVRLDKATKTLVYRGAEGGEKTVRYDDGQVKLDWRLDWPGRWWLLGVTAEPFGRDHASAGGSYETGVALMKDVYEAPAPYPVPYDFINMAGDTKKMSASKGTGLDASEGASIMPAEVVRYFILGAAPSKRLYFDPIGGVVKLMDEYAALAAKTHKTPDEEQLLYICTRGAVARMVSRVPFSHLAASYQASLRDPVRTLEVVQRTEYSQVATEDADIIMRELQFIDAWLDRRAPDDVKFSLREQVDRTEFSDNEMKLFAGLAEKVAAAPADADGAYFHLALYSFKDELGMQPRDMFSALYRLLIGKPHGPRAGYFLSILPRDWLLARLRLEDAVESEAETNPVITSAPLDGKKQFCLDDAVLEMFPGASAGYVVADLPAQPHAAIVDLMAEAVASLEVSGVRAENLTQQPFIQVWRKAYASFGVKPSDYLCSAEALVKRALKGKPAQVNPVVDAYNAVSVKHLLPMGAVDLDAVDGDIVIRFGRENEEADLLGMQKPVMVTPKQVVYAHTTGVVTWLWNHRDAKRTAVHDGTRHAVFFIDSLLGAEPVREALTELVQHLEALGAVVKTQGVIGQQ